MKKTKNKKQNGITLIALIITIVLMLILASVSISMIVNDEIFDYTGQATEKTEEAKNDEQELVNSAINDYIKPNLKITGHDGETFSKIYTKTKEYTDTEGNTAVIPKGFAVGTSDKINKISTGLVIRDVEGNEFVWIPVEVTESDTETSIALFYRSDWSNNARSTSLMESTTYTEPYASGYTGEDTDYKDMLKSVYSNKGFYIGRYEAGTETARTDKANGTSKMVVQRDKYPYIYVGWGLEMNDYTSDITDKSKNQGLGALALSKAMYANKDAGVTSTLCYGIMWDAMLDFIKDDKHNVTNSTTWGNYSDSEWTITRTTARYTTSPSSDATWTSIDDEENDKKSKTSSESILLTTGASDSFSVKNIYDVAGNVYEWTNETYSTLYRVVRGASYNNFGDSYPVSSRGGILSYICNRSNVGFRLALYIK